MSDQLRDKILDGLAKLTDRDKFEACAVDLLAKDYPRLVPIRGGSDGGFDGAALEKDGRIIQLVCTTGVDVLGNLTGSLEQAKKLGLKSQLVLVATSQRLSPQEKRKLQDRTAEFGKTLCPVYDCDAMASLLYHDSKWRKSLLGVSGHPPALSLIPANHRPAFGLPPLGRDEEQAQLRMTTADLVVVGQPGSGKTHLLSHVAAETNGLFAVSSDRTAIADSLRDLRPAWVILDDAHSRLDDVTALRQLRRDLDLDFWIVATCWPGQENDVATKLGVLGQPPLKLLELPMPIIRQIVNALDIHGPDELLHEILHQSAGKAGLAVTLCQICWQHGTAQLFTGEALTRDLRQSLTTLAGEDAVHLLGYFALAGDRGLTIEVAADLAHLPPPTVARMTEVMGAAGVLESGHDRQLTVEPARLRQGLVRDIFCRSSTSLDWRLLLPAMPDRSASVDTLIIAGLLGGKLDAAELQNEIQALSATHQFGELCEHYALLGPRQSSWVLENYPGCVKAAAEPLLKHLPAQTIPLLIRADLAKEVRPHQERDELPELRAWIDERAHTLDSVPRRVQLLEALEQMQDELHDTPTMLAAMRLLLAIDFEWNDQPPGEAEVFRMQHGFVPVGAVAQIAALWPRMRPLLSDLSKANTLKLPEFFRDWAVPHPWNGNEVTQEFLAACQHHGREMFSDLIHAYPGNWVFLHRCQWVAKHLGAPLPAVTGLPAILFPTPLLTEDEELQESHRDALAALAEEWHRKGPLPELLEEWLLADREAAGDGSIYPNFSAAFASEIAQHSADPVNWLEVLLTRDAPARLVAPFCNRCCEESEAIRTDFVRRFHGHEELGWLALNYLVRFFPVSHELWHEAGPSIAGYAVGIGICVRRNEVPEGTLRVLLTSHGPQVAEQVATNLWSGKPKGEIPSSLLDLWREAVIEHVHEGHQLKEIGRHYPEIILAWAKRRLNLFTGYRSSPRRFRSRESLHLLVGELPKEHRRDLIEIFSENNYDSKLLSRLVGGDLDLLKLAISRAETRKRATGCLGRPGKPVTFWVERAMIFLNAGLSEEEVMWASETMADGWTGPESRYLEEKLELYRPLLEEKDRRIVKIAEMAIAMLTQRCDHVREQERIAAVKGRF